MHTDTATIFKDFHSSPHNRATKVAPNHYSMINATQSIFVRFSLLKSIIFSAKKYTANKQEEYVKNKKKHIYCFQHNVNSLSKQDLKL